MVTDLIVAILDDSQPFLNDSLIPLFGVCKEFWRIILWLKCRAFSFASSLPCVPMTWKWIKNTTLVKLLLQPRHFKHYVKPPQVAPCHTFHMWDDWRIFCIVTLQTQNVKWTSHVCSIYVPCPGGSWHN